MANPEDNMTPASAAVPNVLEIPFNMVMTFLLCMIHS
jgi:hypothetical protein